MAHEDLNSITGDVTGNALQAHTIHGGVHFHSAPPDRPPTCPPPSCWATATEPPPEIRALLWAQVKAAHQLPYQLPGARKPSLDTVYVRQNLGAGVEESEQPRAVRQSAVTEDHGHLLDSPAPPTVRITVRPPSRTIGEALDGDAHLLVTGGPGQGKSTLSLRLAADIAEQWTSRDGEAPLSEPVVPLRITARSLAARIDLPFAQALAESINADYGPLLREPVSASTLVGRPCGCRWLLIVDALDEVVDHTHRARLVNALAAWAEDSTYRVLLTTRPVEGGVLAPLYRIGAVRYELQPFDEAALKRFAANWFPPDDARRFLRQIREAHLDELVQVPLLATIAAIIFAEYGTQPLPGNQYSLYETYFAHIRTGTCSPFEHHRVALLEHLARTRLETDTSLLAAARTWIVDRCCLESPTWQDDLTAFLVSVGPFTMRGDDLSFLHHSFAEHLAATSLARELPIEFSPDEFADTLQAARPRESGRFARRVLLHHTRLHPAEADRLLRWLHAGDVQQHLLAARLLCHHLPASTQSIDSFLTTVWDWAMTTQHVAGEILAKATRATHHPGIVDWLTSLMRNENAPWRSRAEAANALAVRVRGPATDEAVALLHHIIDEPGALVQDRLIAAEALAQCGAETRDVAERALRAVLADPHANGETCRIAAVVLATFEGESRAFAISMLKTIMSDPDTRPNDLAEVATGLLEIGVEFHEQSAEAFLSVLHNPADTADGRRVAALGLASLGPDRLAQAVDALTSVITDGSRSAGFRSDLGLVLGELGPQCRRTAGNLILAVLAESEGLPSVRVMFAWQLAHLGSAFRDEAVAQLNAVMAQPGLSEHNFQVAAGALAELGTDLRDQAAAQLAERGAPKLHRRVSVLERLQKLGEPHRSHALDELQSVVADDEVHFEVRCRAARELIQSAPELHEHAISHLLTMAASHTDPEAVWCAWSELAGTRLRDVALDELLTLCTRGQTAGPVHQLGLVAAQTNAESITIAGGLLRARMDDPSRSMRERITATMGLFYLSRAFDGLAARGFADLARSEVVTVWDFSYLAAYVCDKGRGPIGVFVDALRGVLRDSRTTSKRAWHAVQAMRLLGLGSDTEVSTALSMIVSDECLESAVRAAAAIAAAQHDSSRRSTAVVRFVHACAEMSVIDLHAAVGDLGRGLVQQLKVLLGDLDAHQGKRAAAALGLRAVGELRRQVADEYLSEEDKVFVLEASASVDPSEVPGLIELLTTRLNDRDLPVADRVRAAWALPLLDGRLVASVIALLQRLVEDRLRRVEDRAMAAAWLRPMLGASPDWFVQAVMAVARDPALSHASFQQLVDLLPRRFTTELEQILLEDRSAEMAIRVPRRDVWDDLPLRGEAVAVMRDAIAAPETSTRDRVEAAAALADLSWPLVPEAIAALERFDTVEARIKLARLGRRSQVHYEAMGTVIDESKPYRQRFGAALLVAQISDSPDRQALDVLLAARSWRQQVKACAIAEDLVSLRATRDNPRSLFAARRKAAMSLIDRRAEDRAAAARVLEEIAMNTAARPRMRWRAATDLGQLGVRGRKRALVVLRHLVEDESLLVTVRAKAACSWYELKPTAKYDALEVLNGLAAGKPLQRVQVLRAVGMFDSQRAVRELQEMPGDPVVRMQCARAMVDLRRDQREKAAVIARSVAWDESVSRHVRRKAAADLARWSEVCRAEARALLNELGR